MKESATETDTSQFCAPCAHFSIERVRSTASETLTVLPSVALARSGPFSDLGVDWDPRPGWGDALDDVKLTKNYETTRPLPGQPCHSLPAPAVAMPESSGHRGGMRHPRARAARRATALSWGQKGPGTRGPEIPGMEEPTSPCCVLSHLDHRARDDITARQPRAWDKVSITSRVDLGKWLDRQHQFSLSVQAVPGLGLQTGPRGSVGCPSGREGSEPAAMTVRAPWDSEAT